MLSEVCKFLNNWFDSERLYGDFTISGGILTGVGEKLQEGQYFRIIESVFNDGVYAYRSVIPAGAAHELEDETFSGSVWILKIPPEVVALSDEIDAWCAKYAGADSAAMSPYTSESFGGYSYSKGASSGADGGTGANWQTQFGPRLSLWRKPRCRY